MKGKGIKMIYSLIDGGIEYQTGQFIIQAIGEYDEKEETVKVRHNIFNDGSINDPQYQEHLEKLAYFILSTADSRESIFTEGGALLVLLFSGVHPVDAFIAFRKAKSRIIWGDLVEAIWNQTMDKWSMSKKVLI